MVRPWTFGRRRQSSEGSGLGHWRNYGTHDVLGDAENAALQAQVLAELGSALLARRREFLGAVIRFGAPV